MLVKRVVWFLCFVYVLVCFSYVVSFHFKEFICILLFLCCFFVTRLSGLLVCILWSFFLFCFCCFVLNFTFFSFLSKKRTPKKPDTAKTQKSKNAEKNRTKKSSWRSQIVFFIFGGGLKIFMFGLKTLYKQWFRHFQTGKKPPN